jgi:CheY-like chemotaxis protein
VAPPSRHADAGVAAEDVFFLGRTALLLTYHSPEQSAVRDNGNMSMSRVLVVESDANVRELAGTFLRSAGHSVVFATDGAAAMESIVQARPDVVITEVLLKKQDGLTLCRQIKGDPTSPEIGVIVMSILSAAARSKEAGADLFLKKPLMQSRLIDAVNSVIAGKKEILS